jgi:hypothetical protein
MMKVWDPHFHIWDVRPNSPSGHDSAQLFAPDDDPIYTIQRYEADLSMEGFELIGGTFVEAVSVCHIEHDGPSGLLINVHNPTYLIRLSQLDLSKVPNGRHS